MQLFKLKGWLRTFPDSSGLHINFHKSFLCQLMFQLKRPFTLLTLCCGKYAFHLFGATIRDNKTLYSRLQPSVDKHGKETEWHKQVPLIPWKAHTGKLSLFCLAHLLHVQSNHPPIIHEAN